MSLVTPRHMSLDLLEVLTRARYSITKVSVVADYVSWA